MYRAFGVPTSFFSLKSVFPAPDIFYDIDLNPKEEEVDGIKSQESLSRRLKNFEQDF